MAPRFPNERASKHPLLPGATPYQPSPSWRVVNTATRVMVGAMGVRNLPSRPPSRQRPAPTLYGADMIAGRDFHHVKIRSNGADPGTWHATVEIDGKPDLSITSLHVDMPFGSGSLTTVTVTYLATVDIEVPAVVLANPEPVEKG